MAKPLVVLFFGQSNMRSVSGATGGDYSTNPDVFFWDSQASPMADGSSWVVGDLTQDPFPNNGGNNLAFQAAKCLADATGRPVYGIISALGGHHLEAFMSASDLSANGWSADPGEADLYTHLAQQVALALPLIPGGGVSKFDIVMGMIGEANREEQVEVVANKFKNIFKRFELNGWVDASTTDIVLGEIQNGTTNGRFKTRHASALRRLQIATGDDAFPTLKVVPSHGLAAFDNLHYTGLAISSFAKRFADAVTTVQSVETFNPCGANLNVDIGAGWLCGSTVSAGGGTYEMRRPVYLDDTPSIIADDAVIGWAHAAPSGAPMAYYTRYMVPVSSNLLFGVDVDVSNAHPTAGGDFRIVCDEFDSDMVRIRRTYGPAQALAALSSTNYKMTFGTSSAPSPTRTLHADARYFAPGIEINWDGTGAGLRFNFRRMDWE